MNVYDIGDTVKIYTSTVFTDNDTELAMDPDTVRFLVRNPSGTTTTYVYGTDTEIARNDTGDYEMILRPDATGVWRYRIEGLTAGGDAVSAQEGAFEVNTRRVS